MKMIFFEKNKQTKKKKKKQKTNSAARAESSLGGKGQRALETRVVVAVLVRIVDKHSYFNNGEDNHHNRRRPELVLREVVELLKFWVEIKSFKK